MNHGYRRFYIISSGLLLGVGLIFLGYLIYSHIQNISKTKQIMAKAESSLKFPIYRPLHLTDGFHIDNNSVRVPSAGVITFNLIDSKNEKIGISEEARPQKYNIGDFFEKFSNLKEYVVNDGIAAIGTLNGGNIKIASYANDQVWVIIEANSPVSTNQLVNIVDNLNTN